MSEPQTVATLSALLAAEYESPLSRLREADPYVSWPAAADRLLSEKLLADAERHQRDLSELIAGLRGAPTPRRYDAKTASMHYVRFDYLVPEVIRSLRRLIAAYESAGSTTSPQADALISRHLADYRGHLTGLDKLHSHLTPSP